MNRTYFYSLHDSNTGKLNDQQLIDKGGLRMPDGVLTFIDLQLAPFLVAFRLSRTPS
jgi:hypothetical protein